MTRDRQRSTRKYLAWGAGLALAAGAVTAASLSASAATTTYYVSASGSDSAAGTKAAPFKTIAYAQSKVVAGDVVYVRGGTYKYTSANSSCSSQTAVVDAITLKVSGTASAPIKYYNYPGETPIFDFYGVTNNCRIKGFDITGSYIHLKGFEVRGVPQNNSLNHESWGIWNSGSHNTFELINAHHNMGPGIFIQKGSYNLVLNSDSHDNYDKYTSNGAGESADGFGAHIAANSPGNVFRGCRAWNNTDDGFDLINAYSSVLIDNSWSWHNGYIPGTDTAIGNGNGFKVGGYGLTYVSTGVTHTVQNSVAFKNRSAGFYANHHPKTVYVYNNTAYANAVDFNMLGITSSGAATGVGRLRNNIALGGTLTANFSGASASYNSWNLLTMSSSQFTSVSTTGWDAARSSTGALPVLTSLHLKPGSALIDAGTNVGLAYNGSAPDLGAFETGS